jgi:hypothetical protein
MHGGARQVRTRRRERVMIAVNQSFPDGFELYFESLREPRQVKSFPCDESGHVDMDRLEKTVLCEYLYARAVIGKEFHSPAVRRRGQPPTPA